MNISAVLKDLNNPSNAYDTSGEESSDDEAPAGDNRALCDAYEEEEHEQTITIPHDFDDIVDEPVQPPAHSTPTTASAGDAIGYNSDESTLSPDSLEPSPHPESDDNAMELDTPPRPQREGRRGRPRGGAYARVPAGRRGVRQTGVGRDSVWTEVNAEFLPTEGLRPRIVVDNNITAETDADTLVEPMGFAGLYLDDALIDLTVEQTNRYAAQLNESTLNPPKHSFIATWTDVSRNEIKQWLGLTFLTGLIKKNKVRDYWSTNPLHSTPIFQAIMTRNRYQAIKKFIHWNDNLQAPDITEVNRNKTLQDPSSSKPFV